MVCTLESYLISNAPLCHNHPLPKLSLSPFLSSRSPGLASYPIDTIRRRMMMTSGQAVKYSSSFACFQEIIAKEGMSSLFKGAGANVLRAVAGAGVLSGYDALQVCVCGCDCSGPLLSFWIFFCVCPVLCPVPPYLDFRILVCEIQTQHSVYTRFKGFRSPRQWTADRLTI